MVPNNSFKPNGTSGVGLIQALALMTKAFACLSLIALMLASAPALACSRNQTMRAFIANQQEFERKHNFPMALLVPAPVLQVISVTRATSDTQGSCGIYTFVDLDVSMPDGSIFRLDELGFVFRSELGKPQDPFIAFPNFPVTPLMTTSDGKVAHFTFGLVDPPSARSQPFELKIDVLAINHGLQLSESTEVTVTHP